MAVLVILILGIVVSVIAKIKFNFSNPILLLISSWSMIFIMAFVKVFPNFYRMNIKTVIFLGLIMTLAIVLFFLGTTLKWKNPNNVVYDKHRLVLCFNILVTIVTVVFIVSWLELGPPPALGGGSDRSSYYLPGFEFLYLTVYLAYFIGLYLYKVFYEKSTFMQMALLTFFIILRGNKTAIFLVLLMFLFFFGKRINMVKIIIILSGIVLTFYLASFIYLRAVDSSTILKYAKISMTGYRLPISAYVLYDPLIYLVSNLYNLNTLFWGNYGATGLGTISFSGISQILGTFDLSINNFHTNVLSSMANSVQFTTLNTFSAFGDLYVDFGFSFSIVIFSIVSFTSGIFYTNRNLKNNILVTEFIDFTLYATLGLSFFTFYLGNKEIISNLIIIFIVHNICKEKK